MSTSREDSPDWLRAFQAPTHSVLTLSSGSESPLDECPLSEDEEKASPKKHLRIETAELSDGIKDRDGGESPINKICQGQCPNKTTNPKHTPAKRKRKDNNSKDEGVGGDKIGAKRKKSEKLSKTHESNDLVWMLSSDSESCPDTSPKREGDVHHEESSSHKTTQVDNENDRDAVHVKVNRNKPFNAVSKVKSPIKHLKAEDPTSIKNTKSDSHVNQKGDDGDMEVVEDEVDGKHIEPHVSSSRLPLILSEKVQRSKALLECEGESIDLSGDVGAVGRVVISDNSSGNHEMFLDLKGTMYRTTIVPSRTFCVVSFGQSEAKIEAMMNDFIQLTPQSNFYEAETMVEGTLDGFSFDSEDDADKIPKASTHKADQNEGVEEQPKGRTTGKSDKTSGAGRKKGKTAGGKPPKKVKKKSQVPKKTKTKK